ncbi:tol-pal system YbgF family protein [Spirochaetota bacterium]
MKSVIKGMIVLICLTPLAVFGQGESKTMNLEKISDDLKFQNGLQFVKLEKYNKAIEELNEYLEIHINGIHRHEAYKLLGRIYFKRFNYQMAIKIYRYLYEEFSTTEYGVEGYYLIGICYKKMGFDKNAISAFREIISNHPESNYSHRARTQLDLLKLLNSHN